MPLRERLAGRRLLLTGATGFVGKAVLAQCVKELPELEVTVLLRGDAERRLREDVLASAPFAGMDGGRVRALSGDLAGDDLPGTAVDVVIHCAASVSFEQ